MLRRRNGGLLRAQHGKAPSALATPRLDTNPDMARLLQNLRAGIQGRERIVYKATLSMLLDVVLPIAAWMGGYRRGRKPEEEDFY